MRTIGNSISDKDITQDAIIDGNKNDKLGVSSYFFLFLSDMLPTSNKYALDHYQ